MSEVAALVTGRQGVGGLDVSDVCVTDLVGPNVSLPASPTASSLTCMETGSLSRLQSSSRGPPLDHSFLCVLESPGSPFHPSEQKSPDLLDLAGPLYGPWELPQKSPRFPNCPDCLQLLLAVPGVCLLVLPRFLHYQKTVRVETCYYSPLESV